MRQYVTADACFTLDIPEINAVASVTLFPNPAIRNQVITVESKKDIQSLEIFNLLGRTISISTNNQFIIEKPGTYVMGIRYTDGATQALKFIVN